MTEQAFYRVGYSQCRQVSFAKVTRNHMHRHSYYEPCIVISGSGEFEHDSRSYVLQEGDLFVANPDTYHEIRSLRSRDLCLYFLGFYVTRHLERRRVSPQPQLLQSSLENFLVSHNQYLSAQWHLIPLFEHAMKLAIQQTQPLDNQFYNEASLLLINQILAAFAGESASTVDYSEQMHRKKIVEHIEQGLHKPLRVAELARACGMSERNLRRKWKNWSTRSLSDEINVRRVERACQLLLLPDISVADVGYQVGIRDPAQFSRLFKKIKHQAPGAYRRLHMNNISSEVADSKPFQTEYLGA